MVSRIVFRKPGPADESRFEQLRGRAELARFALISPRAAEVRSEFADIELDLDAAFESPGKPARWTEDEGFVLSRPTATVTRLAFLVGVLMIASLAVVFG
jgi:hypothetical protein